jgi:hypothetical protein
MIALSGIGKAQWQEFNPGSYADQIYRTGNVAIGTSGTPLAKLDLGGDLSMNTSRIALRGASYTTDFIKFSGTLFGLTNVDHWNYSGNLIFYQGTSNRATFTLTGDGNVLLGKLTGTPLPTQRLELATGNLLMPNGSGSTDGNIYFGGQPEYGNNGMRIYGGLVDGMTQAGFIDVKTGVSNDGLRFRVDGANGSTERMRVTAAGNVGIATQDPKTALQIGDRLTLQNNIDKAIGYNTYYESGNKRMFDDEAANIGFTSSGDIFLRTAPYGFRQSNISWTNALLVKNDGRIGVNMVDPTYQIDVAGSGDNGGRFTAKRRAVYGVANGGSLDGVKVGVYGSANGEGTGAVYGIYANASGSNTSAEYAAVYANGNIVYTGELTQTSDARLKENVKSLGGAVDKLMQIDAKSYTYKQSGEMANMNLAKGTQFGFIAQDVEQVMPELVSEHRYMSPDDIANNGTGTTYKGVNYIGFIPVVAQAVREQETVIESQGADLSGVKSDVNLLKNQMTNVKSETADLKTQVADLAASNADLKGQVDDLVKENTDLRKDLGNLVSVVDQLKGRLDSLINASSTSGFTNDEHQGATSMIGPSKPNPSSEETSISYVLPYNVKAAELVITDVSGAEVQRLALHSRGSSNVTVNVKDLRAGTYVYSLVADGMVVGSDKMVVVK